MNGKIQTGKIEADFVPGYVCHYQAHGACSTFHSLSTPPIFSLLISINMYMMWTAEYQVDNELSVHLVWVKVLHLSVNSFIRSIDLSFTVEDM